MIRYILTASFTNADNHPQKTNCSVHIEKHLKILQLSIDLKLTNEVVLADIRSLLKMMPPTDT
jgi:hypothetical protein